MRYVIGIGSWVNGDDAIGLVVAEEIQKINKNENLEVVILNQEILPIIYYLKENPEKILIIDAMEADLEAGEWKIFSFEEAEDLKNLNPVSTHEGNLIAFLKLLKTLKIKLEKIKFFGIKPLNTSPKYGLSEILNSKIKIYVEAALKEVLSS